MFEVCLKPREEALKELAKIRSNHKNTDLAIAVKTLSVFQKNRIKSYVEALNNRRDNTTLGNLKLGDRVKYIGDEYTSIANEILTIVEFDEGVVVCTRSSGNYAPIVFPGELQKC
jgi:hypothetical protein